MKPWRCRIGLHRFRQTDWMVSTRHAECALCGERITYLNCGGYQPIDQQWLETGVKSEPTRPPKP